MANNLPGLTLRPRNENVSGDFFAWPSSLSTGHPSATIVQLVPSQSSKTPPTDPWSQKAHELPLNLTLEGSGW